MDRLVDRLQPAHRDLNAAAPAVGYTGAYREPGTVDIEEAVAMQTARGPE